MPRYLCLGGAVIDRKLKAREPFRTGTSNPAGGSLNFGGVARNVSENLARLGGNVRFVSCVGDDPSGHALIAHLAALGVDVAGVRIIRGASTAEYIALIEPDGALHVGAADMAVLDNIYGPLVAETLAAAAAADWMFADCNAPPEVLADIVGHAGRNGLRLAIDVISMPKARRLPVDLRGVGCLFLNLDEARAVLGLASANAETLAAQLVVRGAAMVVLTLGADGALLHDRAGSIHLPAEKAKVVDVTGAGDAMIAGTLLGLGHGLGLEAAARLGTHVAARTVASPLSVDIALSPALADRFIAGSGDSHESHLR
jgi:pseudouridine kinase